MDIIIFGISGDLAERKLVPALLHLHHAGRIPKDTRLIGFSRTEKHLKHFDLTFEYQHIMGSYADLGDMIKLKNILRADKKQLFYMALPPDAGRDALVSIHKSGLVAKSDAPGSKLILMEKPFGKGYEDAKELINFIHDAFSPGQCLKVDHYAGKKELRDGFNSDNNGHLSTKGTIAFEIIESSTVEGRGGFYDSVGALRDIGQNHLLFMLATFFKGKGKRGDVLVGLEIEPDISKYKFGHYEGYDKIETFFSIPAIYKGRKVTLRSGKGFSHNRASISTENGTITLSSGTSAYENILMGAIEGCHDEFLSDEEVLSAWKFIEKIEVIKEKALLEGHFISYPLSSDVDALL